MLFLEMGVLISSLDPSDCACLRMQWSASCTPGALPGMHHTHCTANKYAQGILGNECHSTRPAACGSLDLHTWHARTLRLPSQDSGSHPWLAGPSLEIAPPRCPGPINVNETDSSMLPGGSATLGSPRPCWQQA